MLLADASALRPGGARGESYTAKISALRETECCVGWHLCSAYLKNKVRGQGLRDQEFEPDTVFIDEVRAANFATTNYIRELARA